MVISNTVIALVTGAIVVSNFIGGLVAKLVIKPLETSIKVNETNTSDHETRLRSLESTAQRTEANIDNLAKDVDNLIKKMDQLITIQLNQSTKKGD